MDHALHVFDYIGTFVFAVTGASIAAKSNFDFFGMLFLAFITAVGGGTVRDLIISQPVFWSVSPQYLYLILAATISTFFLKSFYDKRASVLLFLDTLGLGIFVVIGSQKTILAEFNNETVLLMGIISGVLGGILRSVFNSEVSILFKKEVYATVAALTSIIFLILTRYEIPQVYCTLISVASCFVMRYGAIKYNVHLPKAR